MATHKAKLILLLVRRWTLSPYSNSESGSTSTIDLYYRGYMNTGYKQDEKALKNILSQNVTPTNPNTKLNLIIYYKTMKTKSLVIKNSCLPPTDTLQEVNVVYQYSCNVGDCKHRNSVYIGMTSTTLSKRLSFHLQNGAILRHTKNMHHIDLKRDMLNNNTKILFKENDFHRLTMTEAVLICQEQPSMNIQLMPATALPSSRKPHPRIDSPYGSRPLSSSQSE